MRSYHGNNKAFIFTVFPESKEEMIQEKLTALETRGCQFCFPEGKPKKEKQWIMAAHAVLLFVDSKNFKEADFRRIVDQAVELNKRILCVYLEKTEQDAWSGLQLGSSQALFAYQMTDEELSEGLEKAEIFREMAVTASQRRFQRNRGLMMVGLPILAAVIAFFGIIRPLFIVPNQEKKAFLSSLGMEGLTKEDLEKVKEIYIVGDQVFARFVHAWYEDDRTAVMYNYEINEEGEQRTGETKIAVGTFSDLSQLKIFPNLEVLFIEANQITDISPLFEMTKLRELGLNCNPVSSIEGIEALVNLQNLSLTCTNVIDISPAFNCANLTALQLDGTNVSSIEGIEKLQNLISFRANGTQIRDITPLLACEKLEYLCIGNTKVTDLSKVYQLSNLKLLEMEYLGEVSISKLPENLTELQGRETYVPSFSYLSSLSEGTELRIGVDISSNEANPTASFLRAVKGKTFRDFVVAGLVIDSLEELSEITIADGGELNISHSTIGSLQGIEHFQNIARIDLKYDTNLTDLTPLLTLEKLETLTISSDMRALCETQLSGAGFEIDYLDD